MKKIRVRWIIQAVCLLYVPADSLVFLPSFLFLSMICLFMGVWLVFCCICFMRYCGNIG